MSDLSNLLGDLYGDSSSLDGPPVRREPAAAARNEWSGDNAEDDLAAALSAALADPPTAPAPVAHGAPVAPASAPVEAFVPAPAPAPVAAEAWTAAPAPQPVMASVPMTAHAPAMAGPRLWAHGDDDIAPMGGAVAKKKRK